ncbi:BREX-1 system adenine-specific DNA-methyltransferase PglX [Vibrio anguillarum]|uniref:BREX-1 system adenine-specific DNA-methyltransferase PglX n=1 Tax=Vibrio anguillarum TaxID=55601 RepID=UPI001C03B6D8|nr:BREX-1 system adenine-specific DNA-methyltransferase PglX [Vibrio anguillarum]MBT2926802.1 BREX-1 system adenine-specific DNA-methyltransferase PglX [Vibrio anguillarum]
MNTNKLKAYAPKARLAFMDAVRKRAAVLGIYEDRISEASTQGTDTLIEGRIFTRQQGQQRQQLVKRIEALGGGKEGYNQFINEMAFTWFNRFTAIRYMEINEYLDHGFRVLSKGESAQFGEGFEILAHAADVAEDLDLNKSEIVQMVLAGDKEEELFRALLLGQCHQLSRIMPFMFEKLDDATELLLPDNLTKTDSILKDLINDLPEDNWKDFDEDKGQIEVIGWLYQFYISEHKDAVIGKVVKKEDIPAATQLFTPNWIVKYLVQNSLGRQWLATYPNSELKDKMEYYITPAEQSSDVIEQLKAITPNSINPEKIKVLDPACGSGHILVEVYEVLREIYLESGYSIKEIPKLILTKNIFGLDIDDRAAQMAAFAILMKAREDDRRIFSRIEDNAIKLNIYSIQSTEHLDINKLWADLDLDGNKQAGSMDDLFAEPQLEIAEPSAENQQYLNLLRYLKTQFIDAKNLGSLVEVDTKYSNVLAEFKTLLLTSTESPNPAVRLASEHLLTLVEQALTLVNKYEVCVANPPYLGAKGMNQGLKKYAKEKYPLSKFDLFSLFMERTFDFLHPNGFNAMIVMESWMFLSSFEKFRNYVLNEHTILNLLHMPYNGRGRTSLGINFGTSAYIMTKFSSEKYLATYDNLHFDEIDSNGVPLTFPQKSRYFKPLSSSKLKCIPSSPIVFWISDKVRDLFNRPKIGEFFDVREGLGTRDDELFLRRFWEIDQQKKSDVRDEKKWIKTDKSGPFRKWYGNAEFVMNWENNGYEIKNFRNPDGSLKSRPQNTQYFFRNAVSWNKVGSGETAFRFRDSSWGFNDAAPSLFGSEQELRNVHALLCSPLYKYLIKIQGGTLNVTTGVIKSLPYIRELNLSDLSKEAYYTVKSDWDSQECSWDFRRIEILNSTSNKILNDYKSMRLAHQNSVEKLCSIEKSINSRILSHLELGSEFSSEVKSERLSLFANKSYVFSNSEASQREAQFQSSSISSLASFSLGCMMGRYSLDREGFIYAHSGNQGFKELVAEGAYSTFPADDDGIIPLAAEEWLFEDDATSRFRDFVKTVWGEEHLQDNLDFVAESLCLDAIKPKKNERTMDTIRRYFSSQFYKDHLKTYKKRPIYWLFSSGKEKAFECLVYLHRYNESTLARMRTEYVTPLMGRMESQYSVLEESRANASGAEQRRIDKELKSIEKKQSELRAFDEELKHLAEMKISIDLDDGVKVNYGKFGNLLADVKAIHGKKPEVIK